ncbi:hypothetical protein B0H13DRAFT_1964794 [Mycena leptocephala]|nr:hypothetical protein B0H13DRAFT_1964794 [Mycena leptocephala]
MWTKLSSALKSKQAQDGEVSNGFEQRSETLAGPSISPTKRKGVLKLHRDDGSLRLNSPLKLPSIPKKVKSTFNLHVNTSQLTLTQETLPSSSRDLARRSSQELLSNSTSRPKAARRSSFNLLTRRPSLDLLRSPPQTPRSPRQEEPTDSHTRSRAATFGGSVRSILREPNTPGAAKNVHFSSRDAHTPEQSPKTERQPAISRSTPPEDTFLDRLQRSGSIDSINALSGMARFTSSRSRRPSVAEIFAPLDSIGSPVRPQEYAPHCTDFFEKLDVAPISSLSTGLHVPNNDLPEVLSSTPYRDGKGGNGDREVGVSRENLVQRTTNLRGKNKPPSISHDRSASFSFGKSVFYSTDDTESKRSSSGKSSFSSDADSDMTSSSSSHGVSRHRSVSDTVFMSMMRGSPTKAPEATNCVASEFAVSAPEPDPFSANATTYYTPQTMIPTTPPKGQTRHVRTASKEESIIFSLQTQLDLQTGLCSQFEADLRARDELVAMLGNKIAEAEEEDAKKRKFLRAWKKKVGELERTCRFLEDEIEGSRQESMERSIMDEASSEALRMLHRQIAGLERERDGWKRTEVVLREEVRRLEALAGERRNEAVRLRNSLGSLSEKQQQERVTEEALKSTVAALEKSSDEEKQRHTAIEMTWEVEMEDLRRSNLGLASELADFKQQVSARDDTITALKTELPMARSVETTEAGKCALAMERDSLKLQVVKLQAQHVAADTAEQKALELEDDLQGLWDIKNSLEKERDQLKERLREEEGRVEVVSQDLKSSENRVIDALDNVSRLEGNIRRRDLEAAEDSRRNLERATEIEELREAMNKMRREQSAALETALQDGIKKQLAIDTQTFEFKAEIERLKGQTRELQQESADKEVRIVQITKQRAQDKQDLEGLNIALDSKQQELELLKRRLGVRGTVGNTPSQSSKPVHQRRESLVSATPRMARPPSLTSESSADPARERKPSVESSPKIAALNRSTRLNTSRLSRRRLQSARASIVSAPTSRTLSRSVSATVVAPGGKMKSPTTATATSPATTQVEKENADVPIASRRLSDVSASRRLSRIPISSLAQ